MVKCPIVGGKELGIYFVHATGLLEGIKEYQNWPEDCYGQWIRCSQIHSIYGEDHALAYALLGCRLPQQVIITENAIHRVLLVLAGSDRITIDTNEPPKKFSEKIEKQKKLLRIKKDHPGALKKVNLWATDVMASTRAEDPLFMINMDYYYNFFVEKEITNDHYCAILCMCYVLWKNGHTDFSYIVPIMINSDLAKILTIIVKASGTNGTTYGAGYCEWQTLLGRGIGQVDWEKDMKHRLIFDRDKVTSITYETIRKNVRVVLSREIGRNLPIFEDLNEYWGRRWAWCANGAHNKVIDRIAQTEYSLNLPNSVHRRVFSEETNFSPLDWNGRSYATTAEKLEHGKSRALYSVDTLTYIMFNHLLAPVEKVWRNKKVILDPGSGGHHGVVNKVTELMSRNKYNVMIDFEDFNSQHRLDAMAAVIEELCIYVGYDIEITKLLVNSIYDNKVYHRGICQGEGKSGLYSGHRFTSFMNSVLNNVYLMACHEHFEDLDSLHVGDDVYLAVNNLNYVDTITMNMRANNIRAQRIKQSIGQHTSEFLRSAITFNFSIGYVARSISSLVSGNWENEAKLDGEQALRMMLQNLWTIRNRSQIDMSHVCYPVFTRYYTTNANLMKSILRHEVSVDGSPVRGKVCNFQSYTIVKERSAMMVEKENEKRIAYANKLRTVKGYATREYLSNNLTPVEMQILRHRAVDPTPLMLDASYSKTLTDTVDDTLTCAYSFAYKGLVKTTSLNVSEERAELMRRGPIINHFPVLSLIKDHLTRADMRLITDEVGIDVPEFLLRLAVMGSDSLGAIVLSSVAFGDINDIVLSTARSGIVKLVYNYYM